MRSRALGPALDRVIAKLHEHVRKTLQELASTQAIQARAKNLENTRGLGDMLRLVVIAQDAMYQWQTALPAFTAGSDHCRPLLRTGGFVR